MGAIGTAILTILSSCIAGLVAWLSARGKNKAEIEKAHAEAKAIELKNVETAIEIWRTLAKDLHREVAELKSEITNLRKENEGLREAITKLKELYKKSA